MPQSGAALTEEPGPERLKDFRPIAFMHSFSKLFAKCLARRLAPRLKDMVALNQSAFIKSHSARLPVVAHEEFPIGAPQGGHRKSIRLGVLAVPD